MRRYIPFVLIAIVMLSASAFAKTGSTIYTPGRIANALWNIQRYSWAQSTRNSAVSGGNTYANLSDDTLWNLVTPQSIPRGIHVNTAMGCPNCGHAIDAYGNYPWRCDVFNNPWKITCPNCGQIYPKNDFAAFYASGLDSSGVFQYANADRALLYNTEHPSTTDPLHMYCVDDTMGWNDGKGNTYRFIGYYGHYGTWTIVSYALANLRDAYVYTGDIKYARKAAILLYRVAQLYPAMDWNYWYKKGFTNSDGGSGLGKIWGRIWEPGLVDIFNTTYDAIYPALTDTQLLSNLSAKAGGTVTAADVRSLFETNIIWQVHDAILSHKIEGNEGMYQNSMATAAIVLDIPSTTDGWLDWVFHDGDVHNGDIRGGNINRILATRVDDDGMGDEAAPGYNAIWRNMFHSLSDILEVYPRYTNNRIINNPKYAKMFSGPGRMTCIYRFTPNIGDYLYTGQPGLSIAINDLAYAYHISWDPKLAQMAYFLNGGTAAGLRSGGIFDADPEAVQSEVAAAVSMFGPWTMATDNMTHYGLALLRSGTTTDNRRVLSLYYGRNTGHGHKDTLNIELFAQGLSLMPDLGYPEYADTTNASRGEWTNNTISHSTVVVDKKKQRDEVLADCHFVAQGNGVSVAEVSAQPCYTQTSLYQRTTAMVDVSATDSYIVDVFRVEGGTDHMYSLHGPEGSYTAEGLNMAVQSTGTLAGPDILPYADMGYGPSFSNATGYQYLYDVRRDTAPVGVPAVTWNVVDTWHCNSPAKTVKLRVNLVSPPGEVILAHGDPPRNKVGNPKQLWYLLSHHVGSSSTFVSVIEPYSTARVISNIQRTDVGTNVILTITTTTGRVDTIVCPLGTAKLTVAGLDFYGKFGVISQQSGITQMKFMIPTLDSIGGALASSGGVAFSLSGKVVVATQPGVFWMEEPNRTAAVKVLSNAAVAVGDIVNVGGIFTRSGSQRAIYATTFNDLGPGTMPKPLFMPIRSLGGTGPNVATPGVTTTKGLYNIGMLVKVAGVVTYADTSDPAAKFFYVNDGSGLTDDTGYPGVKVLCGTIDPPTTGMVSVTGVVSSEQVGPDIVPRLLIRSADDVSGL